MQRILLTLTLAFPMLSSGPAAMAQNAAERAAPELIVDVDVNDEVYNRQRPLTEADIKTLVTQLKQNGCQTLLVRCGFLGLLPYRTELSYPIRFDAAHARANPASIVGDLETYIARDTKWCEHYAETLRKFNPPAVFIRECHAQGMKALVWLDIFDDGFPGFHSKFLDEHPHCQWVGRDGKTHFKGLTDYSWPEARAFRVAQAKELLDLGADGVHCATSAHCRHLPNTHEADFYGYSQPIVDAFKKKYGVDIRTAANFDKAAWHDLKGEAMVQLYRELADLCHGRGKQLWIGLQIGRYTQFPVDPHFSTHVVARYTNHWKTLVDERIADAFSIGDYEIMSQAGDAYWTAKPDIQRKNGEDLYAWAAREYQPYCKGKTRLYLFSEWLSSIEANTRFFAEVTCKYGFDGVDVHEAADFEVKPGNMVLLKAMAERLQGKTPSP
jgi:hypothetical protein